MSKETKAGGIQLAGLSREKSGGVAVLLLGTIVFVYFKTMSYPFIQDDWGILHSLKTEGAATFLRNAWFPENAVFYRPVALQYLFLLYKLFGFEPLGYHFAALLFHSVNSVLVITIAYQITQERFLAIASGFFYAFAASIHLDSLMWIVGAYDILGAFFFFCTLFFFIKGKTTYSAITFLFAVLTKEATAVLPAILFFVALSMKKGNRLQWKELTSAITPVRYHIAILFMYIMIRVTSSAVAAQESEAYRMKFFGEHIIENIARYTKWSFEAFMPIIHLPLFVGSWITLGILFLLAIFLVRGLTIHKLVMLLAWVVLGILPVLFLESHAYRYYLTYSMFGCIVLGLSILWGIGRRISQAARLIPGIIVFLLVMNGALSFYYVTNLDNQGIEAEAIDGSNNLMRKGRVVTMVEGYLKSHYPVLPDGTILIFDWLPTEAFGKNKALNFWYNTSTISVLEIQQVIADTMGVYLNESGRKGEYIDPRRVLLLEFHGDSIHAYRH